MGGLEPDRVTPTAGAVFVEGRVQESQRRPREQGSTGHSKGS